MRHKSFLLTLLLLFTTALAAQKRHTRLLGVGWANTYDTYLSPLEYSGNDLAFISEGFRMTRHAHVSTQGLWRGHLSYTENPAGNRSELGFRLSYQHAWHYNWTLGKKVQLRSGLGAIGELGGLYNSHSGNNPGQAYLSCSLLASVGGDYSFRLSWWSRNQQRQRFNLRLQLDAPLVGAMFSPNYSQPYYNIFTQGNYSRNVVPTTIFDALSLRGQLLLTIPIGRRHMVLGYAFDVLQAKPNKLRQHCYINNIVLGWEF